MFDVGVAGHAEQSDQTTGSRRPQHCLVLQEQYLRSERHQNVQTASDRHDPGSFDLQCHRQEHFGQGSADPDRRHRPDLPPFAWQSNRQIVRHQPLHDAHHDCATDAGHQSKVKHRHLFVNVQVYLSLIVSKLFCRKKPNFGLWIAYRNVFAVQRSHHNHREGERERSADVQADADNSTVIVRLA
jgi:hypothetical protein